MHPYHRMDCSASGALPHSHTLPATACLCAFAPHRHKHATLNQNDTSRCPQATPFTPPDRAISVLCVRMCAAALHAVLLPGYYAAAMDGSGTVTAAAACPQKYYCPGAVTPGQAFDPSNPSGLSPSEPSIKQCPDGTWTQERAAIAPEQCCEYTRDCWKGLKLCVCVFLGGGEGV